MNKYVKYALYFFGCCLVLGAILDLCGYETDEEKEAKIIAADKSWRKEIGEFDIPVLVTETSLNDTTDSVINNYRLVLSVGKNEKNLSIKLFKNDTIVTRASYVNVYLTGKYQSYSTRKFHTNIFSDGIGRLNTVETYTYAHRFFSNNDTFNISLRANPQKNPDIPQSDFVFITKGKKFESLLDSIDIK